MKKVIELSIKLGSSILVLSLFVACASVNSVSLTAIPASRNKVVKAEVSKFIILGFNFNNDFIDLLVADLKTQCPQGLVTGILTKDETISYFFAHTRRVVATGYCNVGVAAKTANNRSSASEDLE